MKKNLFYPSNLLLLIVCLCGTFISLTAQQNLNHTLEFHRKVAQPLNSVNYLEKNKDIQTVSITNFTLKDSVSQIQYIDLIEEKIEIEKIELR